MNSGERDTLCDFFGSWEQAVERCAEAIVMTGNADIKMGELGLPFVFEVANLDTGETKRFRVQIKADVDVKECK